MGSKPRWGVNGGYDAIITTPKGTKALGEKGAIILANYTQFDTKGFYSYVKNHPFYVAKHCNDINEITHITEDGIVNRYGFLFTKANLDFSNGSIDVGAGWFTTKNFDTPEALMDYIDSIIK